MSRPQDDDAIEQSLKAILASSNIAQQNLVNEQGRTADCLDLKRGKRGHIKPRCPRTGV